MQKYRYRILIAFIITLAVVVFIAETYFKQKRIENTINMVQTIHDSLTFEYDFTLDQTEQDASSEINSASGQIIIPLPDDPNIQKSLGDFDAFIRGAHSFAQTSRQEYSEYDVSNMTAKTKKDYQEIYEFEENEYQVTLDFLGEAKVLHQITRNSAEKKRSLSFIFYDNGNLNRIEYGMWNNESMGIIIKFHQNGTLQEYMMFYNWMILGPVILQDENGVLKTEFYSRPQPISLTKGQQDN
jgi:hypothetical protein